MKGKYDYIDSESSSTTSSTKTKKNLPVKIDWKKINVLQKREITIKIIMK